MNIVILDAATLGNDLALDMFDCFGSVSIYPITAPEELSARIADADIIIVNKIKLNEHTLAPARSLKLICETATGYDNIDTEYCRRRGIAVCNVKGYSSDSVSQVTAALALSLYTHIREYARCTSDGTYTASGVQNRLTPVFHEISGRTWGIVGLGAIGRRTAETASALGCRILGFNRSGSDEYECVPLDELCRRSDIISVHLPLSEDTRGIISARRIALMKQDAVLINMARGAVIDESAAALAVEQGMLGGLAADVYSTEPFGADHPYTRIMKRDNVILTPHMAWGAYEARMRCMNEIAENIRAFLSGGTRNRVV